MSTWQDEGVEILRILINDFSSTPTYTDETLGQLLIVAARYVSEEVNFPTIYSSNLLNGTITPDPSDDSTFLNFMVIKAACLTNQWKFDEMAMLQGIKTKLGPAEISVDTSSSILMSFLKDGACKTYQGLMDDYNFGRIGSIKGIFSPFVSNNFLGNNYYVGRF